MRLFDGEKTSFVSIKTKQNFWPNLASNYSGKKQTLERI